MKCKIRVSVITPVYNGEKTIRDTIEAVLHQTYQDIEYIIIDGASTDRTIEIVKEYEPLFNGRMKYISEKDRGVYHAMNKGIRMSTGHIIGITNSDDFYEIDTVEKIVSVMTHEKYQVIYGYLRTLEKGGLSRVITVNSNSGKMIPHPTCFVTREIYRDYGLFLEWYRTAADYEFMLRLYKKRDVHFMQIKSVLATFRTGGMSYGKRAAFETNVAEAFHKRISFEEFLQAVLMYLAEKAD